MSSSTDTDAPSEIDLQLTVQVVGSMLELSGVAYSKSRPIVGEA